MGGQVRRDSSWAGRLAVRTYPGHNASLMRMVCEFSGGQWKRSHATDRNTKDNQLGLRVLEYG